MQLHHLTHYQHSISDNIHSTNTISYKYRHIDIQKQATPQGAPIYLVVCSVYPTGNPIPTRDPIPTGESHSPRESNSLTLVGVPAAVAKVTQN